MSTSFQALAAAAGPGPATAATAVQLGPQLPALPGDVFGHICAAPVMPSAEEEAQRRSAAALEFMAKFGTTMEVPCLDLEFLTALPPSAVTARNRLGCSMVHLLAAAGYARGLRLWLTRDPDVNARDHKGNTPLHSLLAVACSSSRASIQLSAISEAPQLPEEEEAAAEFLIVSKLGRFTAAMEVLLDHPDIQVHAVNHDGQSPAEMDSVHPSLREVLINYRWGGPRRAWVTACVLAAQGRAIRKLALL